MAALSCTREQALFANSMRDVSAAVDKIQQSYPGATVAPNGNTVDLVDDNMEAHFGVCPVSGHYIGQVEGGGFLSVPCH